MIIIVRLHKIMSIKLIFHYVPDLSGLCSNPVNTSLHLTTTLFPSCKYFFPSQFSLQPGFLNVLLELEAVQLNASLPHVID